MGIKCHLSKLLPRVMSATHQQRLGSLFLFSLQRTQHLLLCVLDNLLDCVSLPVNYLLYMYNVLEK